MMEFPILGLACSIFQAILAGFIIYSIVDDLSDYIFGNEMEISPALYGSVVTLFLIFGALGNFFY